jgi:hypothetical protein
MQQVISQLDHISSTICQTFKHQKKNPIEYNDTMSDFVLKYGMEEEEEEVSGQQ